jgi:hypothetical protein
MAVLKIPVHSEMSFTVAPFNTPLKGTIVFNAGETEMVKIGPDGFWVRGEKVPQDDNEAKAVYEAFTAFIAWGSLIRNR